MSRAIITAAAVAAAAAQCTMPDARPAPAQRKFVSTAVDAAIDALRPRFIDPNLGTLFANTLPNTLDTVRAPAVLAHRRHDVAANMRV